ncbi:hypothetical protein [Sulfobacillus harzensis]|uniref:Uncharacterized protein n=1 Tax=Sulfobacillus harzensis TaxID=2729629 RepID=A0A7Y0Q1Y3_9FIRM|nr:hypothetical protein [Sulfobacillus harzensis]NMP22593.1 hypothetical protein [Sulfobacillus harzensis]
MAIKLGETVTDPRNPARQGTVVRVHTNPACLMRSLEIQWHDPIPLIEELEELEFGPLED